MFWSPHKLARSNLKSIHCIVVLFTDPSNSRSYTSQFSSALVQKLAKTQAAQIDSKHFCCGYWVLASPKGSAVVYGGRNPEDDWLACSPDGVVDRLVYDLPSRGVLEIKCPFFNGDMSQAVPWSRVPLYCIPQAQGLMEIMDKDWMDFYVWTPKGSSLFRLYRDIEYWDVLKMALSDFWWKHVQPAKELCSKSVITNPLTQLRSLRPAPRHELCSYIVYESKHVVDNSKLVMREIYGILQN